MCLRRWSSSEEEQNWLREFIQDGLVRNTRNNPHRKQLLLEHIIGTFNPASYTEIADLRKKILFYAGIPSPVGDFGSASSIIRSSSRLCQRIIERCQNEDDIRFLGKK